MTVVPPDTRTALCDPVRVAATGVALMAMDESVPAGFAVAIV